MPNVGIPAWKIAPSMVGAPGAYTDEGPPERMIAAGFLASISPTGMSCGTTSE
jgi:hypothetical protein